MVGWEGEGRDKGPEIEIKNKKDTNSQPYPKVVPFNYFR